MGRRLLHEYLLRFAKETPDRLALVDADERLTFGELDHHVRELAVRLQDLGIGTGDRVLLVLHPSCRSIALELAVSSVGAAFVPVSPEVPEARAEAVYRAARPSLLVREDRTEHQGAPFTARLVGGELVADGRSRPRPPVVRRKLVDTDPAYIIFTSGSTGVPKGIVMSHGSAVNALEGAAEMGVREGARVASIAPLQFDFSILDLGLSIGTGASLFLLPRLLAFQPEKLVDQLIEQRITQMDCVPSLFRTVMQVPGLIERLDRLDTLVYGGEGFSLAEVQDLQGRMPQLRVVQAFGHSESILCCFKELHRPPENEQGRVSIGRAFGDMEMFALDDAGELVTAPGELGELWIRGPALFSGYFGDPATTSERMVPDPRDPSSMDRAFRSGDLVFQDHAGDFYFFGRKDAQVKIAGNRLELEEVEAVVERCFETSRAIAAVENSRGRTSLVVFLLSDRALSARELDQLRAACGARLPHYALPRKFFTVTTIPMTVNGKVDRQRLLAEHAQGLATAVG